MTYDTQWIMERLGKEATKEDAEAALERAEDWYNSTPKEGVLAWYAEYQTQNQHAESIYDEENCLVDNWNEIVIFNRSVSNAHL